MNLIINQIFEFFFVKKKKKTPNFKGFNKKYKKQSNSNKDRFF